MIFFSIKIFNLNFDLMLHYRLLYEWDLILYAISIALNLSKLFFVC